MKIADLFADLQLGKENEFFTKLDAVIAKAEKKTIGITLKLDDKAVQAQLQAITRGKKNALNIGVDVDTKLARAKMDTFIKDQSKRQITLKVDLNTGKASLEIDKLQAKINKLSGTQRVRVSGSASQGGGGGGAGLLGGLLGLAPAAVPILAATTAGVVGLSGALVAAGAGALAFGGVAKTQFTQIQKSLDGVTKAQAALDQATTPAQRAAGLKKLEAAYAAVDQRQLGVAQGAQRLEKDWRTLNKAIEIPVLVDFNGALAIAKQGLEFIQPLALAGAGALKGVENNVGSALGSPFWKNFGQTLNRETGPAIKSLTGDLGNLVHGGAATLTAFLPIVHQVETGLEKMTSGLRGGPSSGFISYLQVEGPKVAHIIGDIAQAIGVIGKDALPIGGILLTVVDDVAKLVVGADKLNPVIVTLGLGLLSITKLAPLVTGVGKSLSNLGSSLKKANPYAIATGVAVAGVAGYMTVLSNESDKAQKAVDKIDNSFNAFDTSSAVSSIAAVTQNIEDAKKALADNAGGGKGFLGTVAEIGQNLNPLEPNRILASKDAIKAQNAELAKQKMELGSVTDNYAALSYQTGLTRKQIDDLAKSQGISLDSFKTNANDFADQRLIVDAFHEIDKAAGVTAGTIQAAAGKSIVAAEALKTSLQDVADKTASAFTSGTDIISNFSLVTASTTKKTLDKLTATQQAAETRLSNLQAQASARGKSSLAQQQALAGAQDKVTVATQKLTAAQKGAQTPSQQLQATYKKTLDNATAFVRDTGAAITRGLDPQLIQRLLEAGPQKAEPILNALLTDHSGKTIKLANQTETALDRISQSAVEFARTTALAIAAPTDKLSRDLPSIAKVLSQKFAQGGSATVFTIAAKLDTSPARVAQLATEFGVTLKGASALAKAGVKIPVIYDYPPGYIGPIPPGHAVQHVKVVYDYPSLLPGGSVFDQQVPAFTTPPKGPAPHALGGHISGPGSGTSDSILARLSNDEFVVRASSARKNRALLEAINNSTPGFAAGGSVGIGGLLPGLSQQFLASSLPTGGLGSTAVYTAALAGVAGSLKALLASTVQFIQRDLPSALKSGAAGIAGATQQMIDQLAGLRDSYQSLVAANDKAQADLVTARKKDASATKADKSQADSDLKSAITAATDAKKALDQLRNAGGAVKSDAAFRTAEKTILDYSSKLQKAANQNETLTTKINDATQALADAKQTWKDYRDQIAASITSLGDFTQMQANIIDQSQIDGLTSSVDAATTALNDAQTAYDAAFGTKTTTQVQSLSDAQDIYTATVTKYGATSANAKAAADALAAAQGRAATASKNLSSAQQTLARQQGLLAAAQSGRAVSGADIVANVAGQVAAARKFADNIKTLQGAGLGKTALQQILAQGPVAGGAFADALANDLGDIGLLNGLQGQLDAIGQDLGTTSSDWFNSAGVSSAQGILAGLKSQQQALEDYMADLGTGLANAFKEALGIHSPSSVFADASSWLPKGVEVGIDRTRHVAIAAARGLANDVANAGSYGGASSSVPAPSATVGAASSGSGVSIGQVVIQDASDADMFFQKLDFWNDHNGRAR